MPVKFFDDRLGVVSGELLAKRLDDLNHFMVGCQIVPFIEDYGMVEEFFFPVSIANAMIAYFTDLMVVVPIDCVKPNGPTDTIGVVEKRRNHLKQRQSS